MQRNKIKSKLHSLTHKDIPFTQLSTCLGREVPQAYSPWQGAAVLEGAKQTKDKNHDSGSAFGDSAFSMGPHSKRRKNKQILKPEYEESAKQHTRWQSLIFCHCLSLVGDSRQLVVFAL